MEKAILKHREIGKRAFVVEKKFPQALLTMALRHVKKDIKKD
jgi:hypothetical protein